jgi:hypothetical protein
MKTELIRKAEIARKRARPTGSAQAWSALGARELRAAAMATVPTRPIKPGLKLDDLRALAAAARKQLRRG